MNDFPEEMKESLGRLAESWMRLNNPERNTLDLQQFNREEKAHSSYKAMVQQVANYAMEAICKLHKEGAVKADKWKEYPEFSRINLAVQGLLDLSPLFVGDIDLTEEFKDLCVDHYWWYIEKFKAK